MKLANTAMRCRKLLVLIVLLAFAAGMTGCAYVPQQPPEGAFAATYPEYPDTPADNGGAIYHVNYGFTLFEDVRARRIGDIITVTLVENTSGKKSAKTSADKQLDTQIEGPTILGRPVTAHGTEILEQSLNSNTAFEGEGDSSQSNSLSGSITVTVVDVLPNGNLRIRGEKRLSINQGEEYVRLAGIVRPSDITPENSVLSTQVADATIMYTGTGAVADANGMGWLGRFFMSPIWPF